MLRDNREIHGKKQKEELDGCERGSHDHRDHCRSRYALVAAAHVLAETDAPASQLGHLVAAIRNGEDADKWCRDLCVPQTELRRIQSALSIALDLLAVFYPSSAEERAEICRLLHEHLHCMTLLGKEIRMEALDGCPANRV